jgi:hypothetical protein
MFPKHAALMVLTTICGLAKLSSSSVIFQTGFDPSSMTDWTYNRNFKKLAHDESDIFPGHSKKRHCLFSPGQDSKFVHSSQFASLESTEGKDLIIQFLEEFVNRDDQNLICTNAAVRLLGDYNPSTLNPQSDFLLSFEAGLCKGKGTIRIQFQKNGKIYSHELVLENPFTPHMIRLTWKADNTFIVEVDESIKSQGTINEIFSEGKEISGSKEIEAD